MASPLSPSHPNTAPPLKIFIAPKGGRKFCITAPRRLILRTCPKSGGTRASSISDRSPDEVSPILPKGFSPDLLGLTAQGWMRGWDESGRVHPVHWEDVSALEAAGAVVISLEDVGGDMEQVERLAQHTRILAVTEGAAGCVLYWNGDRRRLRAPQFTEIDATGAGDIFAAAFFIRLYTTRDPVGSRALCHLDRLAFRHPRWAGWNPYRAGNPNLFGGSVVIRRKYESRQTIVLAFLGYKVSYCQSYDINQSACYLKDFVSNQNIVKVIQSIICKRPSRFHGLNQII